MRQPMKQPMKQCGTPRWSSTPLSYPSHPSPPPLTYEVLAALQGDEKDLLLSGRFGVQQHHVPTRVFVPYVSHDIFQVVQSAAQDDVAIQTGRRVGDLEETKGGQKTQAKAAAIRRSEDKGGE